MLVCERKKLIPAQASDTLIDIVENEVITELGDIATAEYAREGFETGLKIIVSEFTKPHKSTSAMDLDSLGTLGNSTVKCDFLAGYIEGMIRLMPGFSEVEVSETRCRNEGHPYCLFEFDEG